MSKVSISGNASGSGVFTIASPNSNTDRTLTLPDATGTVLTTATPGVPVNGPAFSAYANASTSLANGTYTKILFQLEEFDTNSNYDTSTSRFTPTVPGYYQVTFGFYLAGLTAQYAFSLLYKNGSSFKYGNTLSAVAGGSTVNNSFLVYMNGSTDYLEVYGIQYSGGTITTAATFDLTYFQAAMVRSA
jgi:hypothetical protein